MALERAALMADRSLTGTAWCRAHTVATDAWMTEVFAAATAGADRGLALVALGGYGRSELCPGSDIDVMLVHDGLPSVASVADRLWYPMWDEGLHLGHSVSTAKEALRLAGSDLDTATSLLSTRHLAGDAALSARLADAAKAQWRAGARRSLAELAARVRSRHTHAGEVAFQLEPDLKEGRGGLRDVHALTWAEDAHPLLLEADRALLARSYAIVLEARVELQRSTRRASNILALQEQDAVAAALGSTTDELMARIADAARTIAWTSDDAWRRFAPPARRSFLPGHRTRGHVENGIVVGPEEVELDRASSREVASTVLALRVAVAAATRNLAIERHTLEALAGAATELPDPWPEEARLLLVDLLLAGAPAIGVIESLDQRGIWTCILPEWLPVRARPQRNAYHRYTVDRHLLECAARAAELVQRPNLPGLVRPDLVVVAALLHDLGKGHGGDHTEAGVRLARRLGSRMGFPPDDVDSLAGLVEHHLLLPEVATRRDLDDAATIARVTDLVGSVGRLQMLALLTQADSLATGPSAWSASKAELIRLLVERATDVFLGRDPGSTTPTFPTMFQLEQLRGGGRQVVLEGDVLTVVTDDRPGILSRVAGVLTLHGVDVVAAAAYSSDEGRALSEFKVSLGSGDDSTWARVARDVERALDGRLALRARVTERVRTYARRRLVMTREAPPVTVHFDNLASDTATVIDVHAPDGLGVLYGITSALADLDIDIRSARVQTLGDRVVDAFYVRDANGKLTDPDSLREIERAILHNLAE